MPAQQQQTAIVAVAATLVAEHLAAAVAVGLHLAAVAGLHLADGDKRLAVRTLCNDIQDFQPT